MWIDSHAHLTSSALFDDCDAILRRAKEARLSAIVNICTDPLSLERGICLSQEHPEVYLAASTTPHDAEKRGELDFDFFAAAAKRGVLKAVGETGLDYHYFESSKEIQKKIFRRYLQLAVECRLPLVIHCREAFSDFFEIIDAEYQNFGKSLPGVLHCFTGSMKEAEALIERGWMISLSGIVTFKKSVDLQLVAKEIPLEQLLIETDAPYLAPQSHRGKTNEPAFLIETGSYIASIKGVTPEFLAAKTSENARRFFCL